MVCLPRKTTKVTGQDQAVYDSGLATRFHKAKHPSLQVDIRVRISGWCWVRRRPHLLVGSLLTRFVSASVESIFHILSIEHVRRVALREQAAVFSNEMRGLGLAVLWYPDSDTDRPFLIRKDWGFEVSYWSSRGLSLPILLPTTSTSYSTPLVSVEHHQRFTIKWHKVKGGSKREENTQSGWERHLWDSADLNLCRI